ncbi:MAG TPA: protein kinase [Myxococcaceae bacterium]|jgi:serine/threonine protein kinase
MTQLFGKYQLLKKLATGGMAEVWLARQAGIEGFAKNVVIKRILPHLAEDREFVEMFKNEALIAANFNHPNIAQVYEFGEANGTYFISMEFIHGEDLGRVMRKAWSAGQWIARPLAIRIVASACEGLYYAHTRTDANGRPLKVVHRDISPQNILISFDGSVKLVDFGIAKAADQVGLTKSGAIKGKFAYMAPEQAAGKPLDHRADIFAIGLVLYELLTGQRPLKRDSELGTLQAALECAIPPPSEVTDVPPELDPVVMNALAKAADDRYRDARQFQVALEETLVTQGVVASSVQISELMETLFADRLQEEKQSGVPQPNSPIEDSRNSGQAPPMPAPERTPEPVSNSSSRRSSPSMADVRAEPPPEPPRSRGTSVGARPGTRTMSLAEEMAEYAAPAGTAVARRRTGETPQAPRRGTSAGQTAVARTPSRSDVRITDASAPRRSSPRVAPIQEEPEYEEDPPYEDPPMPAPRASRAAIAAAEMRAGYEDDPDADPERTRLPPPDRDDAQDTLPLPARRRTGQLSRAQQAEAPPEPAPRRRTSSRVDAKVAAPPAKRARGVEDEEPAAPARKPAEVRIRVPSVSGETLKKVFLIVVAAAVAMGIVVFWPKLMRKPIDGMSVFVSVDTNPKVNVRVRHSDKCGSPEPFTDLGMTPLKAVSGAHIQDTLILENQEQGIYAEEEEVLRFGEPGETKSLKREFRLGHVRLKITPKNTGKLYILRDGRDLGAVLPGAKLELMEGTHQLELRGDKLSEPVPVEVNIKRGDITEVAVDLSKYL